MGLNAPGVSLPRSNETEHQRLAGLSVQHVTHRLCRSSLLLMLHSRTHIRGGWLGLTPPDGHQSIRECFVPSTQGNRGYGPLSFSQRLIAVLNDPVSAVASDSDP